MLTCMCLLQVLSCDLCDAMRCSIEALCTITQTDSDNQNTRTSAHISAIVIIIWSSLCTFKSSFVDFTGCVFPSASSSGYVFWLTAVCTARRQPTLLTASSWLPTPLHVVVCARRTRWRCKYRRRDAPPWATGRFQWQQLEPGTVYHLRREPPTHCCSLDERQRLSSFASRFWTNSLTAADSLSDSY